MEYEISNPSDQCFVSHDEPVIVAAAVTILGNGMYLCADLPTLYMFGCDPDEIFKKRFNITLSEIAKNPECLNKIADCFDTFRYSGKRSSINNIGEAAKSLSKNLRMRAAQLTTAPACQPDGQQA